VHLGSLSVRRCDPPHIVILPGRRRRAADPSAGEEILQRPLGPPRGACSMVSSARRPPFQILQLDGSSLILGFERNRP
jgi:hypothetical protein